MTRGRLAIVFVVIVLALASENFVLEVRPHIEVDDGLIDIGLNDGGAVDRCGVGD